MTDRFTWSAGQFRITRPRGEKFAWGASEFKVVAVPDQKYSDDEPRDEHGRWGEGGGVTWYHGTSEELKPGDVLTPGHEVRHGENDKVWVSDNAYQASKYGAFVYEVHPHEEPVGRQKANHEFSTVGAHVVGTVAESVIREHSNQMAQEAADYDRRRRKDVKYSADQPRDDHGRFGEGSTFYHGSPTAGLTAVAARIDARQFDNATSQLGAFVTDDPKYAEHYAGKTGMVYEATVVLQNPYHMSYSEFNYFQSPDKDADGKSLPGEQWEARAAALKDEAIALRTRLESEGHDGIVVKGSGMRPTEVASFSDIPLTQKKEAKYSADEPRGADGRWGEGGDTRFEGDGWSDKAKAEVSRGLAAVQAVFPKAPPVNRVAVADITAMANKGTDNILVQPGFLDDARIAQHSADWRGGTNIEDIPYTMNHGSGGREWIVAHEYGHILDGDLSRNHTAVAEKLWEYINEPKQNPGFTSFSPRWQNPAATSLYAQESPFEYIAESLTDYVKNGENAHPESRYIGDLFKSVYGPARRPGQKGEGTGHGFRGNRWTGGIDGGGRSTGPPKLVSSKVKPTGLTHEKLTPEQLGDVKHLAANLYRATQHGWSGYARMSDPHARAVPLYPTEHASTLAALGRLQAAGMSHEEMVRSLGLVTAGTRNSGGASISEYNLSTYSRELLMMDAIKANPTDYETNRDMYGTGVERQRLEEIAAAINVQRENERIAEGVRLSQGAHMAEGKFPEFARPELEAVRALIKRDGSLFPERLPHVGLDGKVDPTTHEDGQRVWREHLNAITAVGRAIEEEKVARQGPALATAQATQGVREELMIRQKMAWERVQAIPYRMVDTSFPSDHPRYAEEHQKYLDYTAARGEYDSLKEQANIARIAAESADQNYARVRFDVLSEIRPFATRDDLSIGKSTNAKASEAFKLAASYFPADWMSRAMGRYKLDVGVANGRAFCDGHLAKTGSYLSEDNKSTAVHEMSHFMENYGGRSIEASEFTFYKSRTNDGQDPTRRLRDVQPGYRYKASEITRTDSFADPYMGKDYGGTPRSNYELLSMGMEHLRAPGTKYPATDTAYRHWLLGMLATV